MNLLNFCEGHVKKIKGGGIQWFVLVRVRLVELKMGRIRNGGAQFPKLPR
jgi:hypothetical protein